MGNPGVQCRGLSKRFGAVEAVAEVSLEVEQGCMLALLGPSGCGKTTLLRLIAGFEKPDAGSISISGRTVADESTWLGPERRKVGFVFQDYALFPHLTVEANVGFGVRERSERRRRTGEMLELVGLAGEAQRFPHELSGGMAQRVALARALAVRPDLVLFDEPFSNLDQRMRLQVREELGRILAATGATAIFVTHDQEEALHLGRRVAVMHEGRIIETAGPKEIYMRPRTTEAAEIVGSLTLVRGECDGERVSCALGLLALERPCAPGPLDVLLRPESIALAPSGADEEGEDSRSAVVSRLQYHGSHQHVLVRLEGGEELRVRVGPREDYTIGQQVRVRVVGPVIGLGRNGSSGGP